MGNGWQEWPLIGFTVLGQCVVGGLIVAGLGWLKAENDAAAQRRIVVAMFALWVLMGIGFLASILHLGSPLRAFNSLNRVGASALSNEIASGALFFIVGGLWWLAALSGKLPALAGKVWLIVAMALGLLFVLAMSRVYQIPTVPTWHNGYTTASFFLTLLLSGPLLGALLLQQARAPFNIAPFAALSGLALLITVVLVVLQGTSLGTIQSAVQRAGDLIPAYAPLQAMRIVLLVVGVGLGFGSLLRQRAPTSAALGIGLLLVLVGEVLGRVIFYGLHMTVGTAVAG